MTNVIRTNVIRQSVRFAAPAAALFEFYVDARRHAEVTGQPVVMSRRPGAKFQAFGGMLRGRNVAVEPKRLVVQRWRSGMWAKSDPDSLLVLAFVDEGTGGRIELLHTGVPDSDLKGVREGWGKYYWRPLRAHLARAGRGAAGRKARPAPGA